MYTAFRVSRLIVCEEHKLLNGELTSVTDRPGLFNVFMRCREGSIF